jgi:hypothetical protein
VARMQCLIFLNTYTMKNVNQIPYKHFIEANGGPL